jgi:hypothetical protein
MKKMFIITLLLILVFAYSNISADLTEYSEVAGTIRNTGSGWSTISNSAHAPMNITGVETTNDKIIIRHSIKATKVVTFIVTPDETMASEGVTVGISGGLDYSYIYLYGRNGNRINPNNYYTAGSNIWIYGKLQQ